VTLRDACMEFFKGLTPKAEDFNLEAAITGLSAIFTQYQSTHALDLSWYTLGKAKTKIHFQVLAGALKENQTLTSLSLSGDKIGAKAVRHLAGALEVNQTLTSLSLSGKKIGAKAVGHLAGALEVNQTLTSLSLSGKKIGAKAVGRLAGALKENQTLTSLEFVHNDIGDKGVKHLAKALKVNKTLRSLKIAADFHNDIGDAGVRYLGEALEVNKTLISLKAAAAAYYLSRDTAEARLPKSNKKVRFNLSNCKTEEGQQLNPARAQMSLLAGKPDVANGGSEGNNSNNGNNEHEGEVDKGKTKSASQ